QISVAPTPAGVAYPALSVAAPAAAPDPTYQVEWIEQRTPPEMQAAVEHRVAVTLRNAGRLVWRAGGPVAISYHWLPGEGGAPVVWDGKRTPIPRDIAPGESLTVD